MMKLPIRRIMVPIDGSKNALAALQVAVTLAKDYDAELIVVHVLPPQAQNDRGS